MVTRRSWSTTAAPSIPAQKMLAGSRFQEPTMGALKLLAAPIRGIVRFPLFQLAAVVAIILVLQAADDKSAFGEIFYGLDKLVDSTVRLVSAVFEVKSFTKSWLISGFMIAYVYLACLLILLLVRVAIS